MASPRARRASELYIVLSESVGASRQRIPSAASRRPPPRSRSGSRLLGGRRLRAALLLKDPLDRLLDAVDDDVRAVGLVALLVHAW